MYTGCREGQTRVPESGPPSDEAARSRRHDFAYAQEWIVDTSIAYGGGIVLGAAVGLLIAIGARAPSALTVTIVIAFCVMLVRRRVRRR
jgi:hypothetical protein